MDTVYQCFCHPFSEVVSNHYTKEEVSNIYGIFAKVTSIS